MAFRFTLYDNPPTSSTTQSVWKNVVCGTITSFTGELYIVTRRIGDVTIKVIEDVILNVRGEDALTSVVQGSDNIVQYPSTSYVYKYTAGKLKIPVTGYRYQTSLGHWVSRAGIEDPEYDGTAIFSHTVVDSNDEYTSGRIDAFVYAYELTYDGENYIYFSTFKISESSSITGYGISVNAFEGAITTRVVPITEPDPDGGFPTGSTPSGHQDGTVINIDNGGDTVNVAPPNVSVGVEINMPEPDLPKRALPGSGITIAKVDNVALGALSSALWGRNPQGFDDLWLMFQNYNCNPIAGIVSCVKLPKWVMSKVVATTSKQPIIIAGTSIENFEGYSVGEQTIVEDSFYTGPITQFNSYKDFVGVSVKAYAPFIGWFDLDPNLCFGVSTSPSLCSIRFHYKCDVTTGNLGLTIWANTVGKSDTETHNIPIATGTGNCAYNVLLAGNDRGMGDTINAFKQGMTGLVMSAGSAAMGSPLMAMGAITSGVGMISSILGMQEHTAMVGSHAGNVGYLTYDIPMVIITKPRYVEPPNYSDIYGHPSFSGIGKGETGQAFIKDFLGGYGEFDVHADNIGFANASEQKKIIDLLANGVYV